jgi:hypothetical protein
VLTVEPLQRVVDVEECPLLVAHPVVGGRADANNFPLLPERCLVLRLVPIPIDFGTYFGAGYGIAGQRLGMDGLVYEWGANLDWFFAKYFALGIFVRGVFLAWDNLYIDYNNRSLPGMTVPLPKTSGGAFWTFGVSLNFRAGD